MVISIPLTPAFVAAFNAASQYIVLGAALTSLDADRSNFELVVHGADSANPPTAPVLEVQSGSSGAGAVPEPGTVALALVGVALVLVASRRRVRPAA